MSKELMKQLIKIGEVFNREVDLNEIKNEEQPCIKLNVLPSPDSTIQIIGDILVWPYGVGIMEEHDIILLSITPVPTCEYILNVINNTYKFSH